MEEIKNSTVELTATDLVKKMLEMNVSEHIEKKRTGGTELSYLSWTWAWTEVLKIDPYASYDVKFFANEKGVPAPYVYDENTGYMVFTSMTIKGIAKQMWLPVMDGANKAMKNVAYTYTTKYGDKSVEAATMFDINKTIMRCLVKNISMFGLGLYIYAGEDLPDVPEEKCTPKQVERMKELEVKLTGLKSKFGVDRYEDLSMKDAEFVIKAKEQAQK